MKERLMGKHGSIMAPGALALSLMLLQGAAVAQWAPAETVQLGPRPFYLVDAMSDGDLKSELEACAAGPFARTRFSIAHRGAPLQFPEHTRESYEAAALMGAGIIECDVTFTRDRELVCRHSQCDLHQTTDILERPDLAARCTRPFTPADPDTGRAADALCCTSDVTLAQFKTLRGRMDGVDPAATTLENYMRGTPPWRTDLYAHRGTLLSHKESIVLFKDLKVGMAPELKSAQVAMPFDGTFTRDDYAMALVEDYVDAGVDPADVLLQSFDLDVVRLWLEKAPDFAGQVLFLDGREREPGFDANDPRTHDPSMQQLADLGLRIIAPPLPMLLALDEQGRIAASPYARAARDAGLEIIAWSLERSGPLQSGGGYYFQSIRDAVSGDGAFMEVLDVLASEVGVRGVFSDWPASVTYFANCRGL